MDDIQSESTLFQTGFPGQFPPGLKAGVTANDAFQASCHLFPTMVAGGSRITLVVSIADGAFNLCLVHFFSAFRTNGRHFVNMDG